MENENFEIYWESKNIIWTAKSRVTDNLVHELRKPIGETDYRRFFDNLDAYCKLRNAQKYLEERG